MPGSGRPRVPYRGRMVLLGLLLIVVAAIAILGAVFLLDSSGVEYFGADVPAVTLFVAGALAVVLIGMGIRLMKAGTVRSWRARRERREAERQQAQDRGPGPDQSA